MFDVGVVGCLADWRQHWLRWENIASICVDVKKNGVHTRPWWSGIYSGINKRCISGTTLPPPPTADAFKQHVLGEMYQTATWRHSHLPEALSSWSPFGKRKRRKKKKKGLGGQIDVEKETICSTWPQRIQRPVVQLRDLRWSRNWIGIDAHWVLPKHDTFCQSIMWMSERQCMSACVLPTGCVATRSAGALRLKQIK